MSVVLEARLVTAKDREHRTPTTGSATQPKALLALWSWFQNNHALGLALISAFGIGAGYLSAYVTYRRYGIALDSIDLSLLQFALYGLLPLAMEVAFFAAAWFLSKTRDRAWIVSCVGVLGAVCLGLAYYALRTAPTWMVQVGGLMALALGVAPIATMLRVRGVAFTSIAAVVLLVVTAYANGDVAALAAYRGPRTTVVTTDVTLNATLEKCDLAVVIHAASVWYLVDRHTPYASPTVYSVPDAQMVSAKTAW